MRNRKLLSVGLPMRLSNFRSLLDSIETENPEAIVRYANTQLIVEEPRATLMDIDDQAPD